MKKATFNADAEGRRFLAYHIHNGSLRGLEPNIEGGRAEFYAVYVGINNDLRVQVIPIEGSGNKMCSFGNLRQWAKAMALKVAGCDTMEQLNGQIKWISNELKRYRAERYYNEIIAKYQ